MERNPFEMERNRNNYQNQLYIRSIFPDYYRLNCFSLSVTFPVSSARHLIFLAYDNHITGKSR